MDALAGGIADTGSQVQVLLSSDIIDVSRREQALFRDVRAVLHEALSIQQDPYLGPAAGRIDVGLQSQVGIGHWVLSPGLILIELLHIDSVALAGSRDQTQQRIRAPQGRFGSREELEAQRPRNHQRLRKCDGVTDAVDGCQIHEFQRRRPIPFGIQSVPPHQIGVCSRVAVQCEDECGASDDRGRVCGDHGAARACRAIRLIIAGKAILGQVL